MRMPSACAASRKASPAATRAEAWGSSRSWPLPRTYTSAAHGSTAAVVMRPVGRSGDCSLARSIDSQLNEETSTIPSNRVSSINRSVSRTIVSRGESNEGSPGRFLISRSTATRPDSASRTSCSVGISARGPRPPVASRALISLRVIRCTDPEPSVVRDTSRSCRTTGTPSAVRRTSSSTMSAPARAAARNEASVFSGCVADAPRCATIAGQNCRSIFDRAIVCAGNGSV